MERLKQRIQIANKAIKTLDEVLAIESPNAIERDALIQRFEYSFEAIWKTVKMFLNSVEGVEANSPKAVVRASMGTGLFSEEMTRQALVMVDDRNSIFQY
jgi:nucleotidyltransferase substrate binding protein (TIGR01987 family)